jgi:hypothetical protein
MRRLVLNMVGRGLPGSRVALVSMKSYDSGRALARSENIKNLTLLPTRTFSGCSDQKPEPKRSGRTRYITRRRVIPSTLTPSVQPYTVAQGIKDSIKCVADAVIFYFCICFGAVTIWVIWITIVALLLN